MKIPVMVQMQRSENGATALCMILGYYKRFVPIKEMREICVSSRNGSSPEQILRAAEHYGLLGTIKSVPVEELKNQTFPVMIIWKRRYYALIQSIRGNVVTLIDPASGIYKMDMQKLAILYSGTMICFQKTPSFETGGSYASLGGLLKNRLRPIFASMISMLIFTVVCVGLNLAMVMLDKRILDQYMGHTEPEKMHHGYLFLLLYALLMILYTVCGILKTRLVSKTSRFNSAGSGSRLFKKIFRQPMRFFEQYSPWDIMSRLETNVTLDSSILKNFVPRLIDAGMSVIYVIFLFSYNYIIAAICIAVVAIILFLNRSLQEMTAIASKSMVTYGNNVNASLLNGMNMIDTIKSTGTERAFYRMWHTSRIQYADAEKKLQRYFAASNVLSVLSENILQGVQLFIGAYFVVHGNFTLGGMSLFQGMLGSMANSINNCISSANQLQSMRADIERIKDIEDRDSLPAVALNEIGPQGKLRGRLCARDICYRYNQGDSLALDHVSIEALPGQMIAIVGATGCGKSTLLKILADLYTAESGTVLYDGKRREEIPDVVFHSSVCTVDQEPVMFEDSIYNNIRLWDSTIENYEVILAARDAQIHDRITKEKLDYSATIKENGCNFSGGELQRIELARALAHEPALLLLDEFTSALDALTEENAMRALREKGTTCVIVAHRLSTIVDCDRIYVMDHGRIVEEGTHEELYQLNGLYRKLVG